MIDRARLVATGLPAGSISSTESLELALGWTLTSTAPGEVPTPSELPWSSGWRPARVPGTVALSIGPADLDRHEDYDAADWWYRCSFGGTPVRGSGGELRRLRLDGLATLAEVWLNGEHVLTSANMFAAHEVDVTDVLGEENELVIGFRSLTAALAERRPRPRWKTKLVENQQLRWFRTTLLGRIPGWTPPIAPVGPWRSVWLETVSLLDVEALAVRPSASEGHGRVDVACRVRSVGREGDVVSARLRVGERDFELGARANGDGWSIEGSASVGGVDLWWPRTHGEPSLHACALVIETSADPVTIDCGRIGFRDVRVDRSDRRVRFIINDVPVFCRGSCWTTNDIVSLGGDPQRMQRTLELLADAHGNMVRVGGTMVYETDEFYKACDELGLMVWQDFMFANMDYPIENEAFAQVVEREGDQQLRRLTRHASVVAFCGGSEVEQQAAMFGAPGEIWTNGFFSAVLPRLVEQHAPGAPYWPSTPTGGALPFHVGEGLSHYYGLGAYRRPLEDVRLAGVKFTPECLGFSNVPEAENLRKLGSAGSVPPHDPAWKRGVPRDTGPGWDFEDVRDHYLERLYGVHAVELRGDDLERYLALSRVVTGEVMGHAFAEWRSGDDPCGGALTWFLQDFRPGAGWGVIDSDAWPKAAYHHLRRAWAPRCVRLLDRGLDGLSALILNDSRQPLEATLELVALARGATAVAQASREVHVPARGALQVAVEEALGHFVDTTYAYRFGPPRHEAVVARLMTEGGDVVSEDVYRPDRSVMTPARGLGAQLHCGSGGALAVTLTAETLLYDVRIDVRDHLPEDTHFSLAPGRSRRVSLRRVADSGRPFQGFVEALNLSDPVRLTGPGSPPLS